MGSELVRSGEKKDGDGGSGKVPSPFWKKVNSWVLEVVRFVVYFVINLMPIDKWGWHVKLPARLETGAEETKNVEEDDDKATEGGANLEEEDGERKGSPTSGVSQLDGVSDEENIEVGPVEKGTDTEDLKEQLSVHQASSDVDKRAEEVFPVVLKHSFNEFDIDDMLDFRLVSTSFKRSVDSKWLSMLEPRQSNIPTAYLTDLQKLSRYTKDMKIDDNTPFSSSLIPYTVVIGLGSPCDPSHHNDEYKDKLSCQVFWKAFVRSSEKIGPRLTSLVLDIRVDPQFGDKFAEEIVHIIVTEGLTKCPNIKCMVFITNTKIVEKALSGLYSIKDADPTFFPSFPHLESVEILTLGEGHPSKSRFKTRTITFPSRFLRQHGTTLKDFYVYGNLYDFKSMGVFQAPSLEKMSYEIHHCLCQGKAADLKALLPLPVVEQEEVKKLKTIVVKVNWQWRTSDMSCFFKWLGRNYPDHQFTKITLINTQNPLKSLDPYYHQHFYEMEDNILHQPKVNAYGSDFPWINKIAMPPIQRLELYTEYTGSWEFLKAVRGSLEGLLMQKQEFFRNEEDMKEKFREGLVREIFAEEAAQGEDGEEGENREIVVWDYFPNLKEITIVWRSINYKNVNWDFETMIKSEEYKNKEIVKKEKWRITRKEFDELQGGGQ